MVKPRNRLSADGCVATVPFVDQTPGGDPSRSSQDPYAPVGASAPPPGPYAQPDAYAQPAGQFAQPGPFAQPAGPYATTGSPAVGPGPYGYPAAGGSSHPLPPQGRAPLDAVSVVSLVTALLGLTLVGLVTGLVGLARTSGGHRRGRGLAVAGVAVSVVFGLVQALVLVLAWPSFVAGFEEGFEAEYSGAGAGDPVDEGAGGEVDPAAADEATRLVEPADLVVGHCFMDPPEGEFYELTVVPCDVPHDGEVVALVELEDGAWPGVDEVDQAAWDACEAAVVDAFEAADAAPAGLDYWNFTPTREGWVLYGDRQVQCLAYDPAGPLEAPVLP